MTISVIITSFNQKAYLKQTLNSVLNQTMAPFEIIVCDDCSTDGSQLMIKTYQKRFPEKIKTIFQEKNLGVTRNRNTGIKMAQGDYVTTLDGDDLYYPSKLEKEMTLAQKTGADLVYSNVEYIDWDGNRTGIRYKNNRLLEGALFELSATLKYPTPREVLIKRTCIEKMGLQDESFPINEDFEWIVRLAGQFHFAAVKEPLVQHRIHSKGLSQSNRRLLLETQKEMIKKMLNLVDSGIENKNKNTRKKLTAFLNLTLARIAEYENQYRTAWQHLFQAVRTDFFRSANYDLYLRLLFPDIFKRKSRLPDPLMIGPLAMPFYIVRGIQK